MSSRAIGLLFVVLSLFLGVEAALPVGVTLRDIDGGPTYYQDNGFTYAASAAFNGMSWDDPRFFPIGDDYCFYPSNSTATFKDLGLNFTHRVTGSTDLSLLRNAGIWALPAPGEGSNFGTETMGWHIEEPGAWSDIVSQVQSLGAGLTGRLLQISCTWNQFVYGGIGGGTMQATMSNSIVGNRHLNVPGDDIYWFAASPMPWYQTYPGGALYGAGAGSPITADQMARGDHYGDMVDMMRAWLQTYPAPVGAPYIENDDGLCGSGSRRITPPELNWAVWSTLVHGARWILYFGTTSNFNDGNTFGFSTSILTGQSISMYDQAKATNTLITNLAQIINAPFALNYATVTPTGYVFPTLHMSLVNGIDIMAKYYSGGTYSNSAGTFNNGFYIFATVRGSESQTNINATFTVKNTSAKSVTVVNENRTLPVTNGTTFTDIFATAATVHVYKIEASTTGTRDRAVALVEGKPFAMHDGRYLVSIRDPGPHSLEVLDLAGRTLLTFKGSGSAEYCLSASQMGKGLRMLRVVTPAGTAIRTVALY